MDAAGITRLVYSRLEERGYRGWVVSLHRVASVLEEIERRHERGDLDEAFYRTHLARFRATEHNSLDGRSVIVALGPQPQRKVTFHYRGKAHRVLIPPTYDETTDADIADVLNETLGPHGFSAHRIFPPQKLMAVRSGLAQYGRNNVTYAEGRGSFCRIASYVSDLPAVLDVWHEPRIMAQCEKCTACLESCPTGAIGRDRFLLRAERCLTLHNEADEAFPDWIDPSWHHCLVGCMRCQLCCPVNKPFRSWFEDAGEFSEQETEMILSGTPRAGLPEATARKLARLWLLDDLPLVSRNLSVLIERPAS